MTIVTPPPSPIPLAIAPTLAEVMQAKRQLQDYLLTTPLWACPPESLTHYLQAPPQTLFFKLELWQHGGSFKTRGALLGMLELTEEEKHHGVTAVSAGNHAIAVAYAARCLNIHAKVLMPKTAAAVRVARCQDYGAEVVLVDNMEALFSQVEQIRQQEKRCLIHPFNGDYIARGTGTLALEINEQAPPLDALIIAVGGGGLISGVANAYKQLQPNIRIYGVEPEGAATITQSMLANQPIHLPALTSIADSLSAPFAEDYAYSLCCQFVDGMVTVTDQALVDSLRFFYREMKLAVEPAAAAGFAALMGPLKTVLAGQKVGIIVCGTNTDEQTLQSIFKKIQ